MNEYVSGKKLTLIVPCYNEEQSIESILPEMISFCEKNNFDLIVVNDGSNDHTGILLKNYHSDCMRIFYHKINRGYGAAIKTGIYKARTPYVVTVDADGQHNLEDILRLLNRAETDYADMVVGERPVSSDCSLYRKIGKFLIRLFVCMLVKTTIRDINSGMKLYLRDLALRFFPLCPNNMSFSDVILLLFTKYSCLICSEQITVNPRRAGHSTIRTKTAISTLYEIGQIVILFNPIHFFCGIGFCIALVAFMWSLRCYLQTSNLSIGCGVLWGLVFVMFFLGIVTEHFYRLRIQQIKTWEFSAYEKH